MTAVPSIKSCLCALPGAFPSYGRSGCSRRFASAAIAFRIAESTFSTVHSSHPHSHTSVRISAAVSSTSPKISFPQATSQADVLARPFGDCCESQMSQGIWRVRQSSGLHFRKNICSRSGFPIPAELSSNHTFLVVCYPQERDTLLSVIIKGKLPAEAVRHSAFFQIFLSGFFPFFLCRRSLIFSI